MCRLLRHMYQQGAQGTWSNRNMWRQFFCIYFLNMRTIYVALSNGDLGAFSSHCQKHWSKTPSLRDKCNWVLFDALHTTWERQLFVPSKEQAIKVEGTLKNWWETKIVKITDLHKTLHDLMMMNVENIPWNTCISVLNFIFDEKWIL